MVYSLDFLVEDDRLERLIGRVAGYPAFEMPKLTGSRPDEGSTMDAALFE